VRILLNPDPNAPEDVGGKRQIYLIYNSEYVAEKKNAGRIAMFFDSEFHFDHPDDPGRHTSRLTRSDGVLLLWGNQEEEWGTREFKAMVTSARNARAKGLGVLDPKETKSAVLELLRGKAQRRSHRRGILQIRAVAVGRALQLTPTRRPSGPPMSFAAALESIRELQNPYPGLRPFETEECHLFFGRDQQIAELVKRLERSRLVAVVGLSGCGKSSLVRAGMIPALERTHFGGDAVADGGDAPGWRAVRAPRRGSAKNGT
jgi:hypothetical protein